MLLNATNTKLAKIFNHCATWRHPIMSRMSQKFIQTFLYQKLINFQRVPCCVCVGLKFTDNIHTMTNNLFCEHKQNARKCTKEMKVIAGHSFCSNYRHSRIWAAGAVRVAQIRTKRFRHQTHHLVVVARRESWSFHAFWITLKTFETFTMTAPAAVSSHINILIQPRRTDNNSNNNRLYIIKLNVLCPHAYIILVISSVIVIVLALSKFNL